MMAFVTRPAIALRPKWLPPQLYAAGIPLLTALVSPWNPAPPLTLICTHSLPCPPFRCLVVCLCMPFIIIISLVGMLLWLILLPFKLPCCCCIGEDTLLFTTWNAA